jgi:hypothetical protein
VPDADGEQQSNVTADGGAHQQEARRPSDRAVSAEELAADLSLVLMYLSSWKARQDEALRFWKGFSFEILNQLADQGLIYDSRRAKSAALTEAGVRRARKLLTRYGWKAADPWAGDTKMTLYSTSWRAGSRRPLGNWRRTIYPQARRGDDRCPREQAAGGSAAGQ